MSRPDHQPLPPPAHLVAERVFNALERFMHIEAVSGIVLLIAAAAALIWANSPGGESYEHFWHTPVTFGFGSYVISQSLHFWVNDGLMTIFFLVVGLEIRREIYEGALASWRSASLPLIAALGGVVAPAVIFVALNTDELVRHGWAIPTATDIAFAVGVLALLGRWIPPAVRIVLLALAVIDDIAAILIIALFYSDGLNLVGFLIAIAGIVSVLGLHHLGIGVAPAYIVPGIIVWVGFYEAGIHPSIGGVLLGLLTPVVPFVRRERPAEIISRALDEFSARMRPGAHADIRALVEPAIRIKRAQREILPPVVRVQAALHPYVAFGIMPLFALANAGVALGQLDFAHANAYGVIFGVGAGLVLGKPLGIVLASWLAVRAGLCQLPAGANWRGMTLIGCLGGIGFTMSIFIATLAFANSDVMLNAAKLGVLCGSATAAIVGLLVGKLLVVNPAQRAGA